MVIGVIGESCTGKSTLADKLKCLLPAEVYTGKDYLRLAKNEANAIKLFQEKLNAAVCGLHIIYVICTANGGQSSCSRGRHAGKKARMF